LHAVWHDHACVRGEGVGVTLLLGYKVSWVVCVIWGEQK
jgi:hypothetical protein